MALASPDPGLEPSTIRLRYFHPVRALLPMAAIVAGVLALNLLAGGAVVSLEARSSLLLVVLVAALGHAFMPRSLSADAVEIRWKPAYGPPVVAKRSDVAAIQYLPTAGIGQPRFFIISRAGRALLWVDRFTPARIESLATQLGLPMRSVETAPERDPTAMAAYQASAAAQSRRIQLGIASFFFLLGLAATGGMAWVRDQSAHELAQYEGAPVCTRPPADQYSCRFLTSATVTDISTKGWITLRFPSNTFSFADHRTRQVQLATPPNAAVEVGGTVQVERYGPGSVMVVNGAITTDLTILEGNTSWLLVVGVAIFPFGLLVGLILLWKYPNLAVGQKRTPAPAPKQASSPTSPPGAFTRLLIAYLG